MNPSAPLGDLSHPDRFLRSFYSHAELYAIVAKQNHSFSLSWFVLDCCREFGVEPVRRGLELCCGPAIPSLDFAQFGIQMTGVDTSPEMLAMAREIATERGLSLQLFEDDMITFRAPEPLDFAINFGYNCSYILTNEEMLSHLDAVADCLRPGGIYIVAHEFLAHKYLTMIKGYEPPWIVYDTRPAHFARGTKAGMEIIFEFGDSTTRYDPIRQIYRSKNRIILKKGDSSDVTEVDSIGKLYFPQEFKSLVAQSGRFEFMGWYEDYSLSAVFDGRPEAELYIAVLRRR